MKLYKFISITFAVFALAICFALSSSAARLHGDVNGDGKITADDARLALRASVDLEQLSDEAYAAADVDNTPGVSPSDARLILRASVKLEALNGEVLPQKPDNDIFDPNNPIPFTAFNVFNENDFKFDLTEVSIIGDIIRIKGIYENLSRNTAYYLMLDEMYVNRCGRNVLYSVECTPGKTGVFLYDIEKEYFTYDNLSEPFTMIDISFVVGNEELDLYWDTVSVFPYGEKFAYEGDGRDTSADTLLCGDDDFSISLISILYAPSAGAYFLGEYVVNNTDTELLYLMDSLRINGNYIYGENDVFYDYIKPHRGKVHWTCIDEYYINGDFLTDISANIVTYDTDNNMKNYYIDLQR